MLYKLRTGDIVLCENKAISSTNPYLIVYDTENGYGLWCMGCGEALGFYWKDTAQMKEDLHGFLQIKHVIPKEVMADYINGNYELNFPVKAHDGYGNGTDELDTVIDI